MVLKWRINTSFIVHFACKSQNRAVLFLGKGGVTAISRKKEVGTKSLTEVEIVGVDNALSKILCTNYFIKAQGYKVDDTYLYQDNISAIFLEVYEKELSSWKTQHMNICYFS